MSSSGFSFPPPPPPPPPSASTSFNGGSHAQQRGGWGSGNHRGRGRGSGGHRGGGIRGGHMRDSGHRGGYGAARGYQAHPPRTPNPGQYNSFPAQQVQQNQYNPPQSYATQPFANPSAPMQGHSHVAPPHLPYQQHQVMGPPMGWGLEASGPLQHGPRFPAPPFSNHSHKQRGGYTAHAHTPKPNGVNKRPHHNAARPSAPPPVPSFGNPLPVKPPPAAADATKKPTKKKRKYNQLGLTPKTEDPESSSEDDADEEIKLMARVPADMLKVTYKGQTASLKSKDDIAKWIEERKKRFPTLARVSQRLKEAEIKKAEMEAVQRKNEAAKEEAKKLARESRAKQEKEKRDQNVANAATRATLKAEKLRKRLAKQEMKAAKAEAEAKKARELAKPSQTQSIADGQTVDGVKPAADQPGLEEKISSDLNPGVVCDDETSSSGSDTSSSDSDSDSDGDSAPEESTSKRLGPDRVPPPPRRDARQNKRVCPQFRKTGRCHRGKKCKHLHEKPEREKTGQAQKTQPEGRKSLFQALLARQREDEDRQIMQSIMWLGDRGLLEDPAENKDV